MQHILSVLSAEYVFSINKLIMDKGQNDLIYYIYFFIYNNSKGFRPLIIFS